MLVGPSLKSFPGSSDTIKEKILFCRLAGQCHFNSGEMANTCLLFGGVGLLFWIVYCACGGKKEEEEKQEWRSRNKKKRIRKRMRKKKNY